MLFLFILVMLSSTQPLDRAGRDLPGAFYSVPQPAAVREESLHVALARDGKVFLNNRRVSLDDL